jgi:hypothetical protein
MTVHGSFDTNRITVHGQTFLIAPGGGKSALLVTKGNADFEQQVNAGSLKVERTASFLSTVLIGDALTDQLKVQSRTTVHGEAFLRNHLTVGVAAAVVEQEGDTVREPLPLGYFTPNTYYNQRAVTVQPFVEIAKDQVDPTEKVLEVHSYTRMNSDVEVMSDFLTHGDIFTPALTTDTSVVRVPIPAPPKPPTPDYLELPCGWSQPLAICANVSVLLANNVNHSINTTVDIGTDPLCVDDRNGTLVALGYDCTDALEAVDCGFDMSSNSDEFPLGTLVADLCLRSCDVCECRAPWCYTPEMLDEIESNRNRTQERINSFEEVQARLEPLLAATHGGINPARISLLRWEGADNSGVNRENETAETGVAKYVIAPAEPLVVLEFGRVLPARWNGSALTPAEALASVNQTDVQVGDCPLAELISFQRNKVASYEVTIDVLRVQGTPEASLVQLIAQLAYAGDALTAYESEAKEELRPLLVHPMGTRHLWYEPAGGLPNWGLSLASSYPLVHATEPWDWNENGTHPNASWRTLTNVSCTEMAFYEVVLPPTPPPPIKYRELAKTSIAITGDTSMTAVLNASGDVHLGSPDGYLCRDPDDPIARKQARRCFVSVTSPTTLEDTMTVVGHMDVTTQTAIDITVSNYLKVEDGHVKTLAVGKTGLVPTALKTTGTSEFIGDVFIGTSKNDKLHVESNVKLEANLVADGAITLAVDFTAGNSGARVNIFGPTTIHSDLTVSGENNLGKTTAKELQCDNEMIVHGWATLRNDVTLGVDHDHLVLTNGTAEFASNVTMFGNQLTVTGDMELGVSNTEALVVSSKSTLRSTLNVFDTVTFGIPPSPVWLAAQAAKATPTNSTNITITACEQTVEVICLDAVTAGCMVKMLSGIAAGFEDACAPLNDEIMCAMVNSDSSAFTADCTWTSTIIPSISRRVLGANSTNITFAPFQNPITEEDYPQGLPVDMILYGDATVSNAVTIHGVTVMQNTTAAHIHSLHGAIIGTLHNDSIDMTGITLLDGTLDVTGSVDLGSDGSSFLHALSPLHVDANFTATQYVDLALVTAEELHVTTDATVDGFTHLKNHVKLGKSSAQLVDVLGSALFSSNVDMEGLKLTVDGNVVLGSGSTKSLLVKSGAKMTAGLEVDGVIVLDPLGTSSVTVGAPTRLHSSLTADGEVNLGSATARDDFGLFVAEPTLTRIRGPATIQGDACLKSPTTIEDDFSVIDGDCVLPPHDDGTPRCPDVSVNALTGKLHVSGDTIIDGTVNPLSILTVGSRMTANVIDETSANVGVTVEGITFTKGGFERATVDTLLEFTRNHGVDIEGTLLRDGVVMSESQLPGFSSKGELDMLTLTNSGNSDDMVGTLSTILFRQFYYDPTIIPSSDPLMDAVNAKPAAKIVVGTEESWNTEVETRDSYISLHTAEDGLVWERMRIASNGDMTLRSTDGTSRSNLNCETGNFVTMGNISMDSSLASLHFGPPEDRLYTLSKMPNDNLELTSLIQSGVFKIEMGDTGIIDMRAMTIKLKLVGDFILDAGLQISGAIKFAETDPINIAQRGMTLYVEPTDPDSTLQIALTTTSVAGDLVMLSSATDPADFRFQNDLGVFTFGHDTNAIHSQHYDVRSGVTTALVELDGVANTWRMGNTLRIDSANLKTTIRNEFVFAAADGTNEFVSSVQAGTSPQLSITAPGGAAGHITMNPGATDGLFTVGNPTLADLRFSVRGTDGQTYISGNTIIGSAGPRYLTVASASTGDEAAIQWTDGTDGFTSAMLQSKLTLTASNAAGNIDIVPGTTSGEFRINHDKLVIASATGNIIGAGDMTIGRVVTAPEGVRQLTVTSGDDSAIVNVVGSQPQISESCTADAITAPATDCTFTPGDSGSCGAGCTYVAPKAASSTQGQIQLGNTHTITTHSGVLTIYGTHSSHDIEMAPGGNGEFRIMGVIYQNAVYRSVFSVHGTSGDVVGLGTWTIGDLAVSGSNNLNVISNGADSVLTVSTETAAQRAAAVLKSGPTTGLTMSQTGQTTLMDASGSVEIVAAAGLVLNGNTALRGSLTLDNAASTSDGAVVLGSDTAVMALSGDGHLSLVVSSGDIQLTGEFLRFNNGKFLVEGPTGNSRIAGSLTLGSWTEASAATSWETSVNQYGLAVGNDWTLSSAQDDGNIVLTPGSATGQMQVGSKFSVTGGSGDVLMGAPNSDYVLISLSADAPVLSIGSATTSGSSSVLFGQAATGQFKMEHAGNRLDINSVGGTGTLAAAVAVVSLTVSGSFVVNTDEFTLAGGAGAFAGDLTVGGAASAGGPRTVLVSAADSTATLRIEAAAAAKASLKLGPVDGSSSGVEISQLAAAFEIKALDTAGTIMLVPGAIGGLVAATGNMAVSTGTNEIGITVADAAAGAMLSLSDGGSSTSSLTQKTAALTVASHDGDLVLTTASGSRPADQDLKITGSSGTVATRADVHVGGSGMSTGVRTLTVESSDNNAVLHLTAPAANKAAVAWGAGGSVFEFGKVRDVLTLTGTGTAANVELALTAGAALVLNSGAFSASAAGALGTTGDASIGCATCAGSRALTVGSEDGAAALAATPADFEQRASLSLGESTRAFELAQVGAGTGIGGSTVGGSGTGDTAGDPVLLTLVGPAAKAAEIRMQLRGATGRLTVGTATDELFTVNAIDGATQVKGDLTVGGATVGGLRMLKLQSNNDDATVVLASGYGKEVVLTLEEVGSTKVHTLTKAGEVLALAASAGATAASVISVDAGQAGEIKLGLHADSTGLLSLTAATRLAFLRGDLVIGGATAPAGGRSLQLNAVGGAGALEVKGDAGATLTLRSTGAIATFAAQTMQPVGGGHTWAPMCRAA